MKWLIIPLASVFVLASDYFEDLTYFFELTFKGVEEKARNNLILLFAGIVIINYLLERIFKFLNYKKFYDYI